MNGTERRVRVWPALAVTLLYWAVWIGVALSDLANYPRAMTNMFGALLHLVLFLVLWLSNGTLSWTLRLLGTALLFGGAGLGYALAHRSFDFFSFSLTTVPWALTGWTLWHFEGRRPALLAAAILLAFGVFDLVRWNGFEGNLRSSFSLRWSRSSEEEFLATRGAAAVDAPARPWTLRPGDWPEFRGPERDGVVRGVRIAGSWKDAAPQQLWRRRVGPAWSSLIIVDGFLVTQEQRGEEEAVVCYDASSGKEVWSRQFPVRFTEGISGAGPRATPTFAGGRIYALGASGLLSCLDASNGKPVWTRDLAKEGSVPVPQWGFSASPLVADGKVIVFAGRILAFDAAGGAPAWSRDSGKDSYSSAQRITVRGRTQIVMQDNSRLVGLAPADGAVLWERANPASEAVPMIQPHSFDDTQLLISSGAGIARLELSEKDGRCSATETWSTTKFHPNFNDVVLHDGHLYGLSDGALSCVDLRSGERRWRSGRYGAGQLVLLAEQGLLVIVSEKGELALVEATPKEPAEALRVPALTGKTWNHPTIVQDRLYLRNGEEMVCYRLPGFQKP